MRKLLASLTFGMVTISSGLAVAGGCSKKNDRFDKPTLADWLRKKVLFAIKNDPDFGGVSFGDVWNDSDLTKLAIRLINQLIEQYFYGSSFKTWAAWTGLTQDKFGQDFFANLFRNWIFNIAGDQLYRDYLNAFAQASFLEYDMPTNNENIYFDPLPSSADHTHQGLEWALAEVPYYRADGTPLPYSEIDNSFKLDRKQIRHRISQIGINRLKQELVYSLRDRFNYKTVPAAIDNAITPVFLRLKLLAHYVSKTNQKVFIDRYSGLFFNMMNWSVLDLSNPKIKSNFLMVWQYRVKSQYVNQINAVITDYSKPKSKKPPLLTGDGWNPTDYQTFVDKQLHQVGGKTIDDYNKEGEDPVFGIPHFQGFVAYNSEGKIVNGFKAELYGEALKTAAKAGFLQRNGGNYAFIDKAGSAYATFAFVLPIYVPDILSADNLGSSLNFGTDDQGVDHEAAIELKNYYDGAAYPEDLSWQGLGTSNGRSVKYLRERNTTKPQATWGSYAADGTTQLYGKDGRINPDVDWTNFNLLKWAIYSFGQSKDLAELAKTRFYSIAFNYDRSNLYSQKLYDAIGKYIEEKK